MGTALQFTGEMALLIGLPTALIDMGMNGSYGSGWAPYGLALAIIGSILMAV
jgi:hypothetical protein